MILSYKGITPQIARDVFIAPNATVIGQVEIGPKSSVWFGAVVRGDRDAIRIGKGSNIQDNVVLHLDPGVPVVIGDYCIIGHMAIVHGAQLGNHVLVGMHSTILNRAQIGDYCIIGANSLVTSNTIIPPYSLVQGSPAKVVKSIGPEQQEAIRRNAQVYIDLAGEYLKEGC